MISVNVRCMYGSIMLPRICLYIQLKITGVECHLISHYQVYLSIHCHWTRYNILSQTLIWIVLFKLINLKFNYVIRQYQRKKKKSTIHSTRLRYENENIVASIPGGFKKKCRRSESRNHHAKCICIHFTHWHGQAPAYDWYFWSLMESVCVCGKKSTNFALADILCGWSTMNANFHFIFFFVFIVCADK